MKKKSKRLEFNQAIINKFDKKAKKAKTTFKQYAENIIEGIANDELTLTPNN